MTNTKLAPVITEYIDAVNASDLPRIMATFAPDALVNDARREFADREAIQRWVEREIVGDRVTMAVREVIPRGSETVVRARFDGDFDKKGLPPEIILSSYFTVRDGKIATMIIVFNRELARPS